MRGEHTTAPGSVACRELFDAQYPAALKLRDEEGRLLGEGNAPRDLVETTEIDWRMSRYPGSRYRHSKPINLSALKQLTRNWDDLLDFVAALRHAYVVRYRVDGRLSGSDLWRYSRYAVTVPNYLINRPRDPVRTDQVPALVSVAFKSTAGIFIVAADMFFREVDLERAFISDEVVDYADDHGLFEGASGVCAGPPQIMRDLLGAVVGETRPRHDDEPVASLVGDVEHFFRYGALYTKLEFTKQVAAFELQERAAETYRTIKGSSELAATRLGSALVSEIDGVAGGHRLQRRLLTNEGLRNRLISTLERESRRLEYWKEDGRTDESLRDAALACDERIDRVDNLVARSPQLEGDVGRLVAEMLVDCALLEQTALLRLGGIASEMNDTMERAAPPVDLDHTHVLALLGAPPIDNLADRLGIGVGDDVRALRPSRPEAGPP